MKKFILFYLFLFPCILFGQNIDTNSIEISEKSVQESITNKLQYLITPENINPSDLISNKKKLELFDDTIFSKVSNHDMPQYLWLLGTLKNRTNDTLNLILTTSNSNKTEVYLQSNQEMSKHVIGFINGKEKSFSYEIHNSLAYKLYPKEEKHILLKTKLYLTDSMLSKITIYSNDKYESMLLQYYRRTHVESLLFSILSGGLFLLFFYNVFLFLKTKQKIYLFYFTYLFFTFFNLGLIIDEVQNNVFGNSMIYFPLYQEGSYTLSFIFYTLFIRSMIITINPVMQKTFKIYIALMVSYLIYIGIIFYVNDQNVTYSNVILGYIFRITTLVFAIIILLLLLKNYREQYIKYIFIGSLILTFSYLLHVFFNIVFGPFIINHFFNLIGSLLEILFFTYALHIKTLNIEKEKVQIKNINEIKSRFFANISHEFRTPLTLIKSPVQSLQNEISDVNHKNKLNLIDINSTRMLQLVDQLLELSKIDSGDLKLILKEGNISSFLNTLVEPFQFQAKEKVINFTSYIQKTTESNAFDKDVIEKIVTNLISNAFKYAPQNESIAFTSSVENFNLKLVVSNTGSDVKKDDLPKLFERFYQKNEDQQGVGIGLALVKELVDLYKGTITTTLEKGELSFIVNLPLSILNKNAVIIPSKNETTTIENNSTLENDLPILLIVDDNAEIRAILIDIFKNKYQILEAQDGEEALLLAQKEIPDCIISDVMMPKLDGFEFTKQIKNNELTSFIPVVLLTAKSSDETHLEGLKSTADAFLTKPFNNEIVIATVHQLITERKKLHARYSQELVLKPVDIVINSVDERFIEKLQNILDKNLSNSEFTSEDFASEIGMSRMQLHRKLKSLLGVSATEFLRNERLKVGFELLKQGNGNVSEIAYSVGFSDVSYFSKCFKEMYHCTPSEIVDSSNYKKNK